MYVLDIHFLLVSHLDFWIFFDLDCKYFPEEEEEKNNSKRKYMFRIFVVKYICCKYFPGTILSGGGDTLFVLLDSL